MRGMIFVVKTSVDQQTTLNYPHHFMEGRLSESEIIVKYWQDLL